MIQPLSKRWACRITGNGIPRFVCPSSNAHSDGLSSDSLLLLISTLFPRYPLETEWSLKIVTCRQCQTWCYYPNNLIITWGQNLTCITNWFDIVDKSACLHRVFYIQVCLVRNFLCWQWWDLISSVLLLNHIMNEQLLKPWASHFIHLLFHLFFSIDTNFFFSLKLVPRLVYWVYIRFNLPVTVSLSLSLSLNASASG